MKTNSRRTFVKKTILGLSGIGLLSGVYAWQVEPFWLEFVPMKMPLNNLSEKLVGKTVMQISDIHIGKRFDPSFIKEAFQKAQKYNPDFVVYTGDYVSTYKDKVQFDLLEDVLITAVKGTLGTFAILGNHDYGKNFAEAAVADQIEVVLRKHGITVLRNEIVFSNELQIVGFDDFWGTNFDPEAALKSYSKDKPSIALCHNPDVCDLNIWNDFEGWILSGHTHGGQCKPPFLPAPMLPVKNKNYDSGLKKLDDKRTLYINRALGHLWQLRFNVRPEITVFELSNRLL